VQSKGKNITSQNFDIIFRAITSYYYLSRGF
jgi:hypothetical protein